MDDTITLEEFGTDPMRMDVVEAFGAHARRLVEARTEKIVRDATVQMMHAKSYVAGADATIKTLMDRVVALELENAKLRQAQED